MKKIQLFVLSVVVVLFTACHGNLWDAIEDLDARVARLEELCKEMNTNITSLQTIVSVIQENDVITSITPIEKGGKVIGYTITFAKHDPITIYNGEDGKDGANGTNGEDGKDGYTPILGVTKDSDGVYYWTLDGEWLLDADGNKLRVTGRNGKDGVDGEDGKDGVDGEDGKDGVTPQLKIEDGYWYISYDNGAIWTELGKAVGEDGKDGANGTDGKDGQDGQPGADGKDGQDGDSMFTSVTYDENNVYFTLTDGSVLIVPRGNSTSDFDQTLIDNVVSSLDIDKDVIYLQNIGDKATIVATTAPFPNSKVIWSSSDESVVKVEDGVVVAVDKGYAIVLVQAGSLKKECIVFIGYDVPIDLGLSVKWAICNVGAEVPEDYGDYFMWGETQPKEKYSWETYKYCEGASNLLTKYCTTSGYLGFRDNKTSLDSEDDAAIANWGGSWRMPTKAEMSELLEKCTWIWITQNGVSGYKVVGKNGNSIFLPAAGYMYGTLNDAGSYGYYWTRTLYGLNNPVEAHCIYFSSLDMYEDIDWRACGFTVRPVCK